MLNIARARPMLAARVPAAAGGTLAGAVGTVLLRAVLEQEAVPKAARVPLVAGLEEEEEEQRQVCFSVRLTVPAAANGLIGLACGIIGSLAACCARRAVRVVLAFGAAVAPRRPAARTRSNACLRSSRMHFAGLAQALGTLASALLALARSLRQLPLSGPRFRGREDRRDVAEAGQPGSGNAALPTEARCVRVSWGTAFERLSGEQAVDVRAYAVLSIGGSRDFAGVHLAEGVAGFNGLLRLADGVFGRLRIKRSEPWQQARVLYAQQRSRLRAELQAQLASAPAVWLWQQEASRSTASTSRHSQRA